MSPEHVDLAPAVRLYPFAAAQAGRLLTVVREVPEDRWTRSTVINGRQVHDARTSSSLMLGAGERQAKLELRAMVDVCLRDYGRRFHIPTPSVEPVKVLRYEPGQSYREHADASWMVYRVVSVVMYLNPGDYDGGSTWFPELDLEVAPQAPAVAVFPSSFAYRHEARPVTRGAKFVAVTWASDLPAGESVRVPSGTDGQPRPG